MGRTGQWVVLGPVKYLHLTNPAQQSPVFYQRISSLSDPSTVSALFSLCFFVCLLSFRCWEIQILVISSTTSKLWKSEKFEVKYVERLIIIITGSQVSFHQDLTRQNCIPGQLHSQLVLIRTSQARSYLGLQYSKDFISCNFNIWGSNNLTKKNFT